MDRMPQIFITTVYIASCQDLFEIMSIPSGSVKGKRSDILATIVSECRKNNGLSFTSTVQIKNVISKAIKLKQQQEIRVLRQDDVSFLIDNPEPSTITDQLILQSHLTVENSPLSLETLSTLIDSAIKNGISVNLSNLEKHPLIILDSGAGWVFLQFVRGAGTAAREKGKTIAEVILDLPGKIIDASLSNRQILEFFRPRAKKKRIGKKNPRALSKEKTSSKSSSNISKKSSNTNSNRPSNQSKSKSKAKKVNPNTSRLKKSRKKKSEL